MMPKTGIKMCVCVCVWGGGGSTLIVAGDDGVFFFSNKFKTMFEMSGVTGLH